MEAKILAQATKTPLGSLLKAIAFLGGNLSDERLTCRTGPNDSVQRGEMYCEARRLANQALGDLPDVLLTLRWIASLEEQADELALAGMVDYAHKKALRAASREARNLLASYE